MYPIDRARVKSMFNQNKELLRFAPKHLSSRQTFQSSAEMVVEDGDAAQLEWGEISGVSAVSPSLPHWSMVSIRRCDKHNQKSPPIVFPPIDHENLHVSPELYPNPYQVGNILAGNREISFSESDWDSDLNSSSSFSPSDSSPPPRSPISSPLRDRPSADAAGWLGLWADIFNSKVICLVRFLYRAFTSSRVLLTFRFAAVLVAFLYFWRRRRRLIGGEASRDQLVGMISKRDEKINELLDQVSGMKQMLLAIQKTPTS